MAAVLNGGGLAVKAGAITNGRGGRWAASDELTEQQRRFVTAYVRNGGVQTDAARQAGYQDAGKAGYDLTRNDKVMAAVRKERQRYIDGELASTAAGVMRSLMTDESTPAATRFQAAKWCLEQAGHNTDGIKQLLDERKSLTDMTIEELQTFISAGSGALSALEEQRRRIIDITPEKPDSAQDCAQSDDVTDVLD